MTDETGTQLDEVQWRSPEWIQAFGLRTDNVLDYFSQSPFYDRTSNNQVLKMQSQFNESLQANLYHGNIQQELMKMKGVEFVIAFTKEPDFWIIRKQNRLGTTQTQTLADYYIVGANVYMAPNVHSVLSSRLLSTSLFLKNTLNQLQKMPVFSPSQGHTYPSSQQDQETNKSKTTLSTPLANSNSMANSTFVNTPISANTAPSSGISHDNGDSDGISATIFNNLLNVSMKNSAVYLEDIPLSGVGSTGYDLGIIPDKKSLSSNNLKKGPIQKIK